MDYKTAFDYICKIFRRAIQPALLCDIFRVGKTTIYCKGCTYLRGDEQAKDRRARCIALDYENKSLLRTLVGQMLYTSYVLSGMYPSNVRKNPAFGEVPERLFRAWERYCDDFRTRTRWNLYEEQIEARFREMEAQISALQREGGRTLSPITGPSRTFAPLVISRKRSRPEEETQRAFRPWVEKNQ